MRKLTGLCLGLLFVAVAVAQDAPREGAPARKDGGQKWTSYAKKLDDAFFSTDEARRIGDNVLLYQHDTGGWPKNIKMQLPLDEEQRAQVEAHKGDANESTIDNSATTTEMVFLARLYKATGEQKYLGALLRGFDYLFAAQYDNGGWPQFYPRPQGYYTHVTFNDDAMVNVLKVMRDAAKGKKPFDILPDSLRAKAQVSLEKGVDCILKTQVVRDGKPTVWCAQYDEHTLEPANARAYELVSLSGKESADIVLFLMSLSKPSPGVVRAVESAVEWFRQSEIKGLRRVNFTDSLGRRDYRMEACADGDDCPPMWARFYEIDDNRPFFCDRDGIKRYDLSEIGYERRVGYGWYSSGGLEVYERFKTWEEKYGSKD